MARWRAELVSRIAQAGSEVRNVSYRLFVMADLHLQFVNLMLEVVDLEPDLASVIVCFCSLFDLTLKDCLLAAGSNG